jgi:hypothetical protein
MRKTSGLQGFGKFQQLLKLDRDLTEIGFGASVKVGDITRFNSRVRLANNFVGINLKGYEEKTISGYNGFFQIFLTHSALERFLELNGMGSNLALLGPLMAPYQPEKVIYEFLEKDKSHRLYNFLHERVNPKLKDNLNDCLSLKNSNLAYISAAIRHIFAHGELCAYSNNVYPPDAYKICMSISSFLIDFMDAEFTKKIDGYYSQNAASIDRARLVA